MKFYSIQILVFCILLLGFFACEEGANENPVLNLTNAIQGFVLEDTVGDSIGDLGRAMITIQLYQRDEVGRPIFDQLVAEAETNDEGEFIFNDVSPGEYILFLEDEYDFAIVNASDDSPTPGDPSRPIHFQNAIPVNVVLGGVDMDNNFQVTSFDYGIKGKILRDTDGDGIGDVLVSGHWVSLSRQNENGEVTRLVGRWYTGLNGSFTFYLSEPGNYMLEHRGIGDDNYTCLSNEDTSPEPGEPSIHPACNLIQISLSEAFPIDTDNLFTIE